jgi:uncharacterized protein with HEPN domain
MSDEFLDFIVWDVVKKDIPQIKPQIQQILTDYGG